MTRRPSRLAMWVALAWMALAGQGSAQTISITSSGHFAVGGTPRFLVFVSYFDGLRASEAAIDGDFKYFQSIGVGGVRIFATWSHYACGGSSPATDAVFDGNGALRTERMRKLKAVLDAARARGLVVDLTFAIDTLGPISMASFKTGLQKVTDALEHRQYDHVLFDVQNEYPKNLPAILGQSRAATANELIQVVKAADAGRLVTASANPPVSQLAGIQGDLVAFHDPRNPRGSTWYSEAAVRAAISRARSTAGADRAVYLQEPMPFSLFKGCRNDYDATAGHHASAAAAARKHGAAAWTFHTRSTFDLTGKSFVSVATAAEKTALTAAARSAADGH